VAKNSSNRNNRAAAAQQLAAQMQAVQEAKAKRIKVIMIVIIAVVVLAIAGVVGYMVWNNSHGVKSQSFQQNRAQELINMGKGPKSTVAQDGSITISKNGVGEANAIAGIPTLDIYNDFMCPGCGGVERQYGAQFDSLIEAGKINLRYHPLAFLDQMSREYSNGKVTNRSYGYSTRAASAAFWVAEHYPNLYKKFVDAMYQNQPSEGEDFDPSTASNDTVIKKIVSVGIPEEDAKTAISGVKLNSIDWKLYPNSWAMRIANGDYDKAFVPDLEGGPYTEYGQAINGSIFSRSSSAYQYFSATPAIFIGKDQVQVADLSNKLQELAK
jgi:protein-disulfide isomerase